MINTATPLSGTLQHNVLVIRCVTHVILRVTNIKTEMIVAYQFCFQTNACIVSIKWLK